MKVRILGDKGGVKVALRWRQCGYVSYHQKWHRNLEMVAAYFHQPWLRNLTIIIDAMVQTFQ